MDMPKINIDRNGKHLSEEIDAVIEEMAVEHADTEKYRQMADNLEKLCKAKSYDSQSKASVVGAAASILGILLVLNYEKLDVVTSKALSFIVKPKV